MVPSAIDADHLAQCVGEGLGAVAVLEAFTRRDEEGAVAGEDEARAEMISAAHLRHLTPDHLDVLDARARELAPRHRGAGAALPSFSVREIDELVGDERRIDGYVEQAALSTRHDRRYPGDGLGERTGGSDEAEPSGALGDEGSAIGQEGKAPRRLQALCKDGDVREGERAGAVLRLLRVGLFAGGDAQRQRDGGDSVATERGEVARLQLAVRAVLHGV